MSWTPEIGQEVWLNYPDAKEPLGKVTGYVTDGPRAGQPIIDGERVAHPMFLLPFRCYGEEWQKAKAEGLIE